MTSFLHKSCPSDKVHRAELISVSITLSVRNIPAYCGTTEYIAWYACFLPQLSLYSLRLPTEGWDARTTMDGYIAGLPADEVTPRRVRLLDGSPIQVLTGPDVE